MPVMIWTFTFKKKNYFFSLYINTVVMVFLLLKVKPGNETGGQFKTDVFYINWL